MGRPTEAHADHYRCGRQGVSRPPGVRHRVAAGLYDLLLLIAVWFFATLLVLIPRGGEALPAHNPWFVGYLILVAFLYAGIAWTRSGQTLGMRAWKIRYYFGERPGMSWSRAVLRFIGEILVLGSGGLGYVWVWVDRNRRSWSDRLSGTDLDWDSQR